MSATVETLIWNALLGAIKAIPTSIVPQTSISLPMVKFTKPATANGPLPYLQVTHLPNIATRWLVADDRVKQRNGILQIDYLEPTASGLSYEQARQAAGLLAQHFPESKRLNSGSVMVRVEQSPDVGRGIEDDGYWRFPISIRYESFA